MKIVLQNADITKAKSHRKKAPLELKEGRCSIIRAFFISASILLNVLSLSLLYSFSISMLACSDNHKEIIAWNLPRSRRYPYDVPEQQKKNLSLFSMFVV